MEPKTKEEFIRDLLQSIRFNAHLLRYAETVEDHDKALENIEKAVVEVVGILSATQTVETEKEGGKQ